MDSITIAAYNTHGKSFAERYRSSERITGEKLRECFGDRSRILDIGIGSGIDMSRLMEAGYEVTGLEPSDGLIQVAEEHFPQLKERIHRGGLPVNAALAGAWQKQFDGILCSAVLMHVPDKLQRQALQDMHDLLTPDGRLLLTVSETRDNLDTDRRDEFGRFYANLPRERVLKLCETAGFRLMSEWQNQDRYHRRGILWSTFILAN